MNNFAVIVVTPQFFDTLFGWKKPISAKAKTDLNSEIGSVEKN